MGRVVVDASVVAKWYLPEIHSDSAHLLLAGDQVLTLLRAAPIHLHTASDRTVRTFKVALETGRTAYDSVYLVLGLDLGCPLVTADRKFYEAVRTGPYASAIEWVGELK